MKQSETEGKKVLVVCQGEPLCGVVGMMNCIKQEPGGNNVRWDMCDFMFPQNQYNGLSFAYHRNINYNSEYNAF